MLLTWNRWFCRTGNDYDADVLSAVISVFFIGWCLAIHGIEFHQCLNKRSGITNDLHSSFNVRFVHRTIFIFLFF